MARRFGELEAIALLERSLGAKRASHGAVTIGIGDDAAVLRAPREPLVWTVDTCVEGVHFDRRWLSFVDVGYRSFQAAASDLAAMGARPVAALSSLILPAAISRRELGEIGRGQAAAARELACPVAGGNISRGAELSVTTSVLGRARRPLLRSGARRGDEIWLLGEVGLARAGLLALSRGLRSRDAALQSCIASWRRPRAQITRGLGLAGRAHAAIDVSDGLGGDLGHLAEASGVAAVVEHDALETTLSAALIGAARRLGVDALELALSGGEDYALIATGPARRRPRFARRVGRIESGSGAWLERDGRRRPLSGGFEHLG